MMDDDNDNDCQLGPRYNFWDAHRAFTNYSQSWTKYCCILPKCYYRNW